MRRRNPQVLLVERDHATAEMYRVGLLMGGFAVDMARDGEEGIQRMLLGELPDIVVIDLDLPRIDRDTPRKDSLDMLTTLRSIHLVPTVPVVALSSDATGFDDALSMGATACMANWRTTPRDLARKVAQLLGEPRGS